MSAISHSRAAAQTTAVRIDRQPVIDGRIEESWIPGRLFDAFVQIEPDIDRHATLRTEVSFLYDRGTVFLAARMTQPKDTMRSSRSRRDSAVAANGDYVAFFLDPAASGNAAYFFLVNPSNAIQDGILDASGARTTQWDGRFASAVQVDEEGWSVEIAVPLDALDFQSRPVQQWGILCERYYAQEKRRFVSRLVDENRPFEIASFHRLLDLRDLERAKRHAVTPYAFAAATSHADSVTSRAETGVDLELRPTPPATVLVTINPDYAQLESDRAIINVSDVPESYPEKRPFFTISSDLYPGLAVNTRRIRDIAVGAKLRHVLETVKYDVTAALDTADARWALADFRWTNSRTFHAEAIAGLKVSGAETDYNVTTNVRGWWLNRRFSAYNWFGTVNSRHRSGREWETVNAVRWDSRRAHTGVWTHLKTAFYDPSIVGHATLANEILLRSWAEYVHWSDGGRVRVFAPRMEIDRTDLFSENGHAFWSITGKVWSQLDLGPRIGLIECGLSVMLPSDQTFRYRAGAYRPFADAFGRFALVEHRRSLRTIEIGSQASRRISASGAVRSDTIRGSPALAVSGQLSWRLGQIALASLELERLRLQGSAWQASLTESVQRLKLEYNVTDRMNIRGILGLHTRTSAGRRPAGRTPDQNLTVSWERRPGSFVHFVYNDSSVAEEPERQRSVAFKFSQRLGW